MAIRDQVRDNLRQLITLLVGFVIASLVALLPNVPLWSSLLAAVALLPPLVFLTHWLSDPPSVWRERVKSRLAVLGVPVAAAVGVLLLGALVDGDVVPARSLSNIEIVLDGSASMAGELDGQPKAAIAADKVSSSVSLLDDSALALRAFGGDCGSVPELMVDFGTRKAEEVKETASNLEPRGEANLVDAVAAAIDDFSNPDLYPEGVDPQALDNRILVITGSSDTCGADQTRLEDKIQSSPAGLDLKYTLIGFDIGDEQSREDLQELAARVDGEALFAETADELDALLDDLVYDGFFGEVENLTILINDVSGLVFGREAAEGAYLDAVAVIQQGDNPSESVRDTRMYIDSAREMIESTEPLFQALRRPHGPREYQELWDIDVEQRQILAEEIERIEDLVSILEDDGRTYEDEGRPMEIWEELQAERERFDGRNDEFDDKAEAFLESLRAS